MIHEHIQPFRHTFSHSYTHLHTHSPIHPHIHARIHSPTAESAPRATASWLGAVRVRRLAQGHFHTELGGAGDPTSDLQVTSQPAPPPRMLVCSIV